MKPKATKPPETMELLGAFALPAAAPLFPVPAPAPSERLPGPGNPTLLIEYQPMGGGDWWRVERWEEFKAEFPSVSDASGMTQFHLTAAAQPRQWLIARRLFGIMPLIPAPDTAPDDMRPHSRSEICAAMGLELSQISAELDVLRVLTAETLRSANAENTEVETEEEPAGPVTELKFGDEVLREFGFEESMFQVVSYNPVKKEEEPRSQEANKIERDWFCKRVQEWSKMLAESVAGALAREALMNELYLRRFGQEMGRLGPTSLKWKGLYDLKKQIEQVYQQQISDLQEMFPEMAIAGKVSFRACISDLNRAHREYKAHGSHALIDKIFTATEIEVMTRASVQMSEAKYRFGLNIAIIEAIHGLYDPNWRPQFKQSVLKKLDAAAKAAISAAREAQNEPLVDMEKGVTPGEGEDFPDLITTADNAENTERKL